MLAPGAAASSTAVPGTAVPSKEASDTAASVHAEPNWARACIDLEALKAKGLSRDQTSIVVNEGDIAGHASAMQAVEADVERAGGFVLRILKGEEEQLRRIAHAVTGLIRANAADDLCRCREEARGIARRLGKLEGFILDNFHGVEQLLGEDALPRFNARALEAGLSTTVLDKVCTALADVFEFIRQKEHSLEEHEEHLGAVSPEIWKPPDSFERSNKKFIVHQGRFVEVKMKVAEQIPVLIMGRPSLDVAAGVPSDFLSVPDSSWVCSQYFDNGSFACYHKRIQRLDGAKAYRVRWYGSTEPPPKNQDVYIERKTHHVEWVAQSSIKERCKLSCPAVQPFLSGADFSELSAKNQRLAAEIQTEMQECELKPVLRTMCRRTAFQCTSNNDVRVSFDADVGFIDEKTGFLQYPSELAWCSNAKVHSTLGRNFGNYGILEVKLKSGEEMPSWVKELEECGAIISMPNLSKFGHGICLFHHDSGNLVVKPYWFDAVVHERLGGRAPHSGTAAAGQVVPSAPAQPDVTKQRPPVASSWPQSSQGLWRRKRKIADTAPTELLVAVRPKKPAEAKTFFANERTLLQWISPVALILSMSIAMLGFSSTLTADAQRTVTPLATAMMSIAIAWLGYALFIYIKRLRKIRAKEADGFDEVFGPSMMVISLFVLCCFAMVLIIARPFDPEAAAAAAEEHFGRPCVNTLADATTFPVLGAEPSGLIYHPGRNSIFVASPHHLLEITQAGVVDHPFPGFDIEAVTIDPSDPSILFLGLEGPNQIVALNTETMTLARAVDVSSLMGANDDLEALAACPPALCGEGGRRFLVGGPSGSLRVLDLGNYPATYPWSGASVIDVIDVDALMCRRIGRCKNRSGRITDLYISSDAVYAVAEEDSQILKLPWSANKTSKLAAASVLPQTFSLPSETRGNWQGFCLKPRADGAGDLAILANDFHGFVKEFHVGATELTSAC